MMLLDTSGLLAILDRREPQHELACLLYRQARLRITHGFVLAELVALGLVRGFPSSSTIDFLRDLIANPDITVIWPAQDATAQALSYLTDGLLAVRRGELSRDEPIRRERSADNRCPFRESRFPKVVGVRANGFIAYRQTGPDDGDRATRPTEQMPIGGI